MPLRPMDTNPRGYGYAVINKDSSPLRDDWYGGAHSPSHKVKGCAAYFFLIVTARYFSSAETMEGAWGCGALISSVRPASSTAREVLLPKAPILVPFCLNFG